MHGKILTIALAVVLGAGLATIQGVTQQQQPPQLTIEKVKDDIYNIVGDGGNVAVLVTSEGVILVDDKFEQDHDAIMEKVKSVTNQPVKYVFTTHYHADHVGGVLSAPNFPALARKTIITTDTAVCLVNTPHRPHLKLSAEAIQHFIVLDYPSCYPVAPGIVLIKAAGHSPDSQMVFIRLQSGKEILHSVDSAWIMDNIRHVKGKAAPWVKEDVPAVTAQLRWLKRVHETERTITILVTHDDELFASVTNCGIVGGELAL